MFNIVARWCEHLWLTKEVQIFLCVAGVHVSDSNIQYSKFFHGKEKMSFLCILLHYVYVLTDNIKCTCGLKKKYDVFFFLYFRRIEFSVQILIKFIDIKFQENPSGTIHINICEQIKLTNPQHEANMCFPPL